MPARQQTRRRPTTRQSHVVPRIAILGSPSSLKPSLLPTLASSLRCSALAYVEPPPSNSVFSLEAAMLCSDTASARAQRGNGEALKAVVMMVLWCFCVQPCCEEFRILLSPESPNPTLPLQVEPVDGCFCRNAGIGRATAAHAGLWGLGFAPTKRQFFFPPWWAGLYFHHEIHHRT